MCVWEFMVCFILFLFEWIFPCFCKSPSHTYKRVCVSSHNKHFHMSYIQHTLQLSFAHIKSHLLFPFLFLYHSYKHTYSCLLTIPYGTPNVVAPTSQQNNTNEWTNEYKKVEHTQRSSTSLFTSHTLIINHAVAYEFLYSSYSYRYFCWVAKILLLFFKPTVLLFSIGAPLHTHTIIHSVKELRIKSKRV